MTSVEKYPICGTTFDSKYYKHKCMEIEVIDSVQWYKCQYDGYTWPHGTAHVCNG